MKTNKDKFNYTAVGVMLYHCPCCAAEWRTNKLDYCPNCEVKLIYSAGEEVYMKCNYKEATYIVHAYNDEDNEEQFHIKKLTRPVVTDEEIDDFVIDFLKKTPCVVGETSDGWDIYLNDTPMYDTVYELLFAAIKELNR